MPSKHKAKKTTRTIFQVVGLKHSGIEHTYRL